MLQKLHERIQGLIAWIVVLVIAVTFTLFGVDYYFQGRQQGQVLAEVNGVPLDKDDFDIQYRRERQQHRLHPSEGLNEPALKEKVLESMIEKEVNQQAAKQQGFEVSSDQANTAILQIPQFQEDGRFSPRRYQQALGSAMYTPNVFLQAVRQGMLQNQQRFAFVGSAFALPNEAEQFVKLYLQTRDYSYFILPAALFKDQINLPQTALLDYYKNHDKEFIQPEKVKLSYLRLSLPALKSSIVIKPSELQDYYEENKNNFLIPKRWEVARLVFPLEENANPEQVKLVQDNAEKAYQQLLAAPISLSQFKDTAAKPETAVLNINPEELPQPSTLWIEAGRHSNYDSALSDLKPGEIAKPLRSKKGFEIFQLQQVRPASIKPFETVKGQIEETLQTEKAQKLYGIALEKLNDLSYQNPDTLEPAAQALELPIKETEFFSKKGGKTAFTKNKQLIRAAFSHEVLALHNNSEAIQIDNDTVMVFRIKKHLPARKASFEATEARIKEKLLLEEAQKRSAAWAKNLLGLEKDPTAFQKALEEKGLTWEKATQVAREPNNVAPEVNDLAFTLSMKNPYGFKTLPEGDQLIVHLEKIDEGRFDALDAENQTSMQQQIESSYGLMDYELYMKSLLQKAKITRTA